MNPPPSAHVLEQLPDLLLGLLDAPTRAAVEQHLEACGACAAARADFTEVQGYLALVLAPEVPRPEVRARVLASCARGRLWRFAGQVSALFAIDEARARAVLDELDDPAGWEPALLPGAFHRVVHVEDGLLKFFIRVPAGTAVPRHEHHGLEQTLVVQGRLVDDAGQLWLPGEQMPKETGTRHSFRADGAVDLVCGVVVENGVTLVY